MAPTLADDGAALAITLIALLARERDWINNGQWDVNVALMLSMRIRGIQSLLIENLHNQHQRHHPRYALRQRPRPRSNYAAGGSEAGENAPPCPNR